MSKICLDPLRDVQCAVVTAYCERCDGEIYAPVETDACGAMLCPECRAELDDGHEAMRRTHFSSRADWLAARAHGIGASEAAAAVGRSPWKTNVQLWEEKTGRRAPEDISGKEVVRYGTHAEDPLRTLFTLDYPDYRVAHHPFDMLSTAEHPWLFATLDGELTAPDACKGVLEIKTAEVSRRAGWDKWRGRIPDYYYTQILHQLLATGFSFAILKAQLKGLDGDLTTRHYRFERSDVSRDLAWLLERETAFWHCVAYDKRPHLILPEI